MSSQFLKWHNEYPFRIQYGDTDVPLFHTHGDITQSKLSPLTNLTLNVLTSSKFNHNFIICVPSMTLRPIPLISYILADRTQKSVLVYSRNRIHYNNYYLTKVRYGGNWAYTKYPAGIIEKGIIKIELYAPSAKRSYREWFKTNAPDLKEKFFDKNYPKILFNLSKNIRFSDSIKNLNLENETFKTPKEKRLGIGNIIFENLDFYIYNSYKFQIFSEWIEEFKDENHRFILHFSNPNYTLLNDMKELFNAYVFYYPLSFIRTNEDLKSRNKAYFKSFENSQERKILNDINLDNLELYALSSQENIHVGKTLRKGNIDKYFSRGMQLFDKINWKQVEFDIVPIIFQLKSLYFSVYKVFCIPNEFSVKYFTEDFGWKSLYLDMYLKIASRLFRTKSKGPTTGILHDFIIYLSKIVSELSECKRYLEPKSYTRKGKNCALCEFLNSNKTKNIIIGVQSGEKKLIYEKIGSILGNDHVKVATLRQLARGIKDFSEHTLILAGHLLQNHLQILFKNWKEIIFLVYRGKNYQWVKNQIKLLDHIDLSKEELSFKYLAEINKSIIGQSDYSIQEDPLFRNFLERKRKLLTIKEGSKSESGEVKNIQDYLEKEVTITSTSIIDISHEIMKSNPKYKDMINEERTKSVVKVYNKKHNEKYLENLEQFECIAVFENEMSGKMLNLNLDIRKKYLCFTNLEDIKIETCFPHSLKKDYYVILFGEKERLSISDFIKDAFELEVDIDQDLIKEWQGRLSTYYVDNYLNNYKKFHKQFIDSTPSTISYQQFKNWIKGNTTYTKDPMNLCYLGQIMEDDFFTDNYRVIHEEGIKNQSFNQKLSKKIKKLVIKVLDGNISRADCSPDELLLLENIENCIYKINDIQIKK